MLQAPQPSPGQTGPRRPYPPTSYKSVGRLCDLSRIATQPEAQIVQWSLSPRLPGNRFVDTYSSGIIEFSSGYRCPVCTTHDRHGCLLLEWLLDAPLNEADAAAAARAVVGAHVRALALHSRHGAGVRMGGVA